MNTNFILVLCILSSVATFLTIFYQSLQVTLFLLRTLDAYMYM